MPGWRTGDPNSPCSWPWTTPPARRSTPSSAPARTPGLQLLDGLIQRWGIPLALYSDRHALQAQRPPAGDGGEATQFTRGLQELGIRQTSPAGGHEWNAWRRPFSRLVTELRLADARTIGQATAVLRDFLPRFNARFAVQPEHPDAAYRPVAADLCLSETLCFKHTRKVGRDNTVKYHWRVLQLLRIGNVPATPDCGWRSWNAPTANSSSSTRGIR